MLYRILTENKNYNAICQLLSEHFEGFTIIKANGYWQGKPEHSLIIEIETTNRPNVEKICYAIKKHNKQEAVMLHILNSSLNML